MSKHQPEKYKEQLLIALQKHLGIVSRAVAEVGISRDRFYHYYKTDEEFKAKVDDIQEIQLDFVEGALFDQIRQGSEKSIIFYMRFRGKRRGYSDELNINQSGISEIEIKFIDGDNKTSN